MNPNFFSDCSSCPYGGNPVEMEFQLRRSADLMRGISMTLGAKLLDGDEFSSNEPLSTPTGYEALELYVSSRDGSQLTPEVVDAIYESGERDEKLADELGDRIKRCGGPTHLRRAAGLKSVCGIFKLVGKE